MVSVFKQLARQYKNVRADLKVAVHYSEDEKVLKDKKALLDSIIAYLNSYEWLSRDGSIEKVRTYLKSGFDYDFVCKSFGFRLFVLSQRIFQLGESLLGIYYGG